MRTLNWKSPFNPLKRNTLRTLLLGTLLVGGGAGVLSSGCSAADNFFDCQAVCTKYRDCFDSSYDVGGCRDNCRAQSDADSSFRQKADVCEACIDGKSCTGSFTCTTECAGIIAASSP